MTTKEFSDNFDVLLNSYAHRAGFGDGTSKQDIVLDEYEKSLFLTQAQEQLILSYYSGKNSYQESFEKTQEIRDYLSSLVATEIAEDTGLAEDEDNAITSLTNEIFLVTKPEKYWFTVLERVVYGGDDTCIKNAEAEVVPVTHDTFSRIYDNPFKGPNRRRVLRMDVEDKIELISKYPIAKYILRYVKQVTPIVLTTVSSENLSVDTVNTETACALHEALHRPILELAVRLALQSKGINIENNTK